MHNLADDVLTRALTRDHTLPKMWTFLPRNEGIVRGGPNMAMGKLEECAAQIASGFECYVGSRAMPFLESLFCSVIPQTMVRRGVKAEWEVQEAAPRQD